MEGSSRQHGAMDGATGSPAGEKQAIAEDSLEASDRNFGQFDLLHYFILSIYLLYLIAWIVTVTLPLKLSSKMMSLEPLSTCVCRWPAARTGRSSGGAWKGVLSSKG